MVFSTLPETFNESALVDRFHGFIKGWELPRMKEGMKAKGWGLNVEYFTEVMHRLRDDMGYRAIVNQILEFSPHADTRDVEAIKRLSTAYLKLLFPYINNREDISSEDFRKFCLLPAMEMRGFIRKQLHMMDREYKKDLPKPVVVLENDGKWL